MKFFKHVSQLYLDDWKRVAKSKMAIIMVLALLILPCFYAWFNIKALWDPYSNTGDLPVAVYSADRTQVIDMGKKKIDINIGSEVVQNLRKNDKIGWKFVDSKEQLVEGVKAGKYYAGIYIPTDFSSHLMSFLKGTINKPKIDYYVNEKINAIAPKITDKGAGSIQQTITEQFIGTVSSAIFTTANKAGIDLDSHLMDVEKIRNLVLYTNEHLSEINDYMHDIVRLNEHMPQIKVQMDKTKDFVDTTIPKVNQAGAAIVDFTQQYPRLVQQLSVLNTLPEKIPQIQNVGRQLAGLDQNFGAIENTVQKAKETSELGLAAITKAQAALPTIQKTVQNADRFVGQSQQQVKAVQEALPQITKSVNSSLVLVQALAENVQTECARLLAMVKNNELTKEDKKQILQFVQQIQSQLQQMNHLFAGLANILAQMDAIFGNQHFQSNIAALEQAQKVNGQVDQHLQKFVATINQASNKEIVAMLRNVAQLANHLGQTSQKVAQANIGNKVQSLLQQLNKTLASAKEVTTKVGSISLAPLFASAKTALSQADTLISRFQKELPSIQEEVHSASTLLNGNMPLIIKGIRGGQQFYQEGLPLIGQQLNQTSNFITGKLPNLEMKLQNLSNIMQAKLPELAGALNTTSAIIESEWPQLQKGIQKLAAKMKKGATTVDVKDIVKLLKNDVKQEVDFMKNPIALKQHNIYPIPNYGSQSAPFYTVLCLWVGGLLSSSLLSSTPYFGKKRPRKDKKTKEEAKVVENPLPSRLDETGESYTLREGYVAKMLIFLTIAFIQAMAVTLGNFFILKVYALDKVWYFCFALLVAFSFTSLIYMFVGLLKDVGKAVCVIILVLSISGGGGNFPIQLSGPFFQAIYPYLPFTYAVNLIREATGGIYWPNALYDLSMLLLFAVVSIVLGIVLCPHVEKIFEKMEENINETHFFS